MKSRYYIITLPALGLWRIAGPNSEKIHRLKAGDLVFDRMAKKLEKEGWF